jgi:hypothetical protein
MGFWYLQLVPGIQDTDADSAIELSNRELVKFSKKDDVRSLYPPECAPYIHITAWIACVRLRRRSGRISIINRLTDHLPMWSLVEPVINESNLLGCHCFRSLAYKTFTAYHPTAQNLDVVRNSIVIRRRILL